MIKSEASLFNHEWWAVILENSPWNVTCIFFRLWCKTQKSIRTKGTIPKHVQSEYPPIRLIESDVQRKHGQRILSSKVWIYHPPLEYQQKCRSMWIVFSKYVQKFSQNTHETTWGSTKKELGQTIYLFAKPPQLVRNWLWIKFGFGQNVKVIDPFLRLSKHTILCFLLLNIRIGFIG